MVLSMRMAIKRVGERNPGRRKPICEAGVRVRQRPVMRRARRREAIRRRLLGNQMVTALRGMAAVRPAKAADHARGHRYHEHLEHGLISILVDVQLEPQLLLQLLLLLRVQMRSFVGIITVVHVVHPIGVVVVVLIINVRFVTITGLHFGRVVVLRGRSWWARRRRRRARWRWRRARRRRRRRRRRWRRLLVVTNLMCQVMSIIGVCTAETALGCRVVRARVQCGIRASNVCVSAVGWHVRCRLLVNWWRRRRRRRR